MSTKRFDVGQTEQPDKLNQQFSFTGKICGADVLLRLVGACGYEVVYEALGKLKPKPAASPAPKRRKAKINTDSASASGGTNTASE